MDTLTLVRTLIWDVDKTRFPDDEFVNEIIIDSKGNKYKAAATLLTIVLADPDRVQSYSEGRVSKTRSDLKDAIALYERLACGGYQSCKGVKSYGIS